MSGSLTTEQLARVAELERRFRAGELISMVESLEYTALKDIAKRMAGPAEKADDPKTWLVDESRRPDVVHGGDYNDTLHAMCRDEVETALRKGLETLGRAALKVVVERVMG